MKETTMTKPTRSFALTVSLLLLTSCVTPVPPGHRLTAPGAGVPQGPAHALAVVSDKVYAATDDGLFVRDAGGKWVPRPLPAGVHAGEVTALASAGDELAVGTRKDGLQLLREGTWSAVRAADGALPDDEVLALAWEKEGEGLTGGALWVGTRTGFARRLADRRWEASSPAGRWLAELSPFVPPPDEEVFTLPGVDFGVEGREKSAFRGPVTAVTAGPAGIAFGNGNGKVALVLKEGGVGVFSPDGAGRILTLAMEKDALWAGTGNGLLWAGNPGKVQGHPSPSWRGLIPSSPVIFGPRDLRPFDLRWYQVGYNTASVPALALDVRKAVWVGFAAESALISFIRPGSGAPPSPSSGFRRFPNPMEYMARGAEMPFEEYGSSLGVRGVPLSLAVGEDGVWFGSASGIFHVK
jgi:hypothetical protein